MEGTSLSDSLHIQGGKPLSGLIKPSGNKNSALPIICATLLTDEPNVIHNVPDITDIQRLMDFFERLGSEFDWDKEAKTLKIQHKNIQKTTVENLPEGMRSSVMLFGPVLYRTGALSVKNDSTGCSLGAREVDPHLEILAGFGADINWTPDREMTLKDGFKGFDHWFDYASVTATEHFLMCASVAKGSSSLINAASEPHVQDVAKALEKMGAKISGIGTSVLTIEGVDKLGGLEVDISDDHHEIFTFLGIGAITGGEVRVENSIQEHFPLLERTFNKFGVEILHDGNISYVPAGTKLKIQEPITKQLLPKVEGAPWPYFPVDLMPIVMALATVAEGEIMFWNKVYEGAFGWLPELQKYGVRSTVCDPHRVIISGRKDLVPAEVKAPYIIRVVISLFMVASSIKGKSVIQNASPVKRAHPNFVENLQSLGADVFWSEEKV